MIAAHPGQLRLEGLCSHLAGAESVGNHFRIRQQSGSFFFNSLTVWKV